MNDKRELPPTQHVHVLEARSLDLGANKRKRPPPASGKPDGAPPLFDEITVRAAQDDLRSALATNARLCKPARAVDHVTVYLRGRGIPVDRKKQERTMRRHIVNPVLAGR
jgi:hypothetical protein